MAGEGDALVARCGRCGGPIEHGQLTGNMGRWWEGGKLGWLPWPRRFYHHFIQGEPLAESIGAGIRIPASRCPACQVVWFSYAD